MANDGEAFSVYQLCKEQGATGDHTGSRSCGGLCTQPAKSSGDILREHYDLPKHLYFIEINDLRIFQLTVSFYQCVNLSADANLCHVTMHFPITLMTDGK